MSKAVCEICGAPDLRSEVARLRAENAALERTNGALAIQATEALLRATQAEAEAAAMVGALKALLVHWNYFTGPECGGWGNQEQAYYGLAKHAQKEWQAAQGTLANLPARAKAMAEVVEAALAIWKDGRDPAAWANLGNATQKYVNASAEPVAKSGPTEGTE